jgi:hypothetical protein
VARTEKSLPGSKEPPRVSARLSSGSGSLAMPAPHYMKTAESPALKPFLAA